MLLFGDEKRKRKNGCIAIVNAGKHEAFLLQVTSRQQLAAYVSVNIPNTTHSSHLSHLSMYHARSASSSNSKSMNPLPMNINLFLSLYST